MVVETIVAHPELKGLRRFALVTRDAPSLSARYGFETQSELASSAESPGDVPTWMQRWDPDVYRRAAAAEQHVGEGVSVPRR